MAKEKLPTKEELAELRKLNEQLGKGININNIKKDAAAVKELLESWKTAIDAIDTSFEDASESFKDSVNYFTKGNEALKDSISATKKLAQLSQDLAADKEGIYEMDSKDLEKTISKIQKEQLRLKIVNKMLDVNSEEFAENKENLKLSNEILKKAQERLAMEQHITNQMGVTGAAVKATAGIFEKLGVGGFLELDKINEKMREVAKEGGSKMKVLGAGMKESFKSAGLALRDPVTMIGLITAGITKLVSLSLKYEDKQFEVAKAMGVSVTEGQKMLNNFQSMAMANGQLAMTARQLADTYAGMNDTLGFMGPQNAEFLTTTAGIQRRLGVSAESMQALQLGAMKAGQSLTKTYSSVIGIAKATGATLKVNMSEKQILEGIAKVSATVFNNFKGNVKQLAAAVVTATKFGTTLDTISQQGNSLLDFESSISKEFEAQLLTGKDLNLNKARELALNHDTKGLMDELNSKMMTSNEYNKMNVLQQQAFAEAVGLSKEQMDEMYHKQEMVKLLGDDAGKSLQTQYNSLKGMGFSYDEIAAKIGDQAAQDAKRATAQEQMQATMERISDEIGKATHGIAEMVTKIAEFFSHTENIKATLSVVGGIMAGMVVYALAVSAQKKEQALTEMMIKKETLQQATLNNRILATQVLQNNQSLTAVARKELETVASGEKAAMETAGAAASVTAGSSYLGPGAIIVGMLAATALMGLISSMGGPSKSVSAPSMPAPTQSISPMNAAAESAKTSGAQRLDDTGKKADRGTNVYVTLDPITGKKTEKILVHDYGVSSDTSAITNPSNKH